MVMKVISAILTLYILVLTFIPCSDHFAETDCFGHDHTEEHHRPKEHSHDHSKDSCTPFCTCSCCGISLTAAEEINFPIIEPFETHYSIDRSDKEYSLINKYNVNIWQPPQV
ncbi:DUF6660 family protein [Sphingobacterium lactis]|uniref:Uncharacterized protein n=1 Tax=Sphingobacterium lactis TaxID=797291 RepID=A0A1H5XIF9_9SPHI|nr:DUF6660 family protein [Sphingobacterium lactis]SEG11026.1 hypothetical protein SAMN05421877_1052 [Sphingobacterium lactis]